MRILDGSLAAFEAEENAKFEAYIESIENETLEGGNDEFFDQARVFFCSRPFPHQFLHLSIKVRVAGGASGPTWKSVDAAASKILHDRNPFRWG